MIRIFEFDALKPEEILNRDIRAEASVEATVDAIIADVRARGDAALKDYALKFDHAQLDELRVSQAEIDEAFEAAGEDFVMFLTLYRLPCIYHISILIKHRKRCPGKFHACRNIGLRKGYFCRLVLKYRFQLYHFHILSLIFGSHFQSLKRRDIPCRSCKFFDIVSTKWKVNVKYCPSIFPTDCFSK